MDNLIRRFILKAPQSLASERAVLGGLLLNCKLMQSIENKLSVEDFVSLTHKKIFYFMGILWNEHGLFDAALLSERLPELEEDIFFIANTTPSLINVEAYCDIVLEKSLQRKLIDAAINSEESGENTNSNKCMSLVFDYTKRKARDRVDGSVCAAQERLVSFFIGVTNELDNFELTEEYLMHTIVEVNKALVDTLRHIEEEHNLD